MLEDTLLYVLAFALIGAFIGLFAVPKTRPYAKKYGWTLIAVAVTVVAFIFLRPRPGQKAAEAKEDADTDVIKKEALTVLDTIANKAEEQQLQADAELARRTLVAEEDRKEYDAMLKTVNTIDDSLERRKALIKLVAGTKKP